MGFYLDGRFFGNGAYTQVVGGLNVLEGQTVKTVIDMNSKAIKWYLNDTFLYMTEIHKQILKNPVCPFISLYSYGDTLELIED